jgi:hypothetical protein
MMRPSEAADFGVRGSRKNSAASAQPVPLRVLRIHEAMLRVTGGRINGENEETRFLCSK